ncbi:MAG: RNA polymerase sigma factor region1.1 domain-containing protein, partial [Thermoleophilia bacterium]
MTVINLPTRSGVAEPLELATDELRALLVEGREQGYLTSDRIVDELRDIELTPEQIESILMTLTDEGIELLESDETTLTVAAAADSEEESPALDLSLTTVSSDPVRLYLSAYSGEFGRPVRLKTATWSSSIRPPSPLHCSPPGAA